MRKTLAPRHLGIILGLAATAFSFALITGNPLARADESASPTTNPVNANAPSIAAPATQPSPSPRPYALNSRLAGIIQDAVATGNYKPSEIRGGAFAKNVYEDICPDGLLIGFRISLGKFLRNDVIKFLQPIYLTPKGETWGQAHGIVGNVLMNIKAPKGYAVGSVTVRGGGGLDAITVTFMRIRGNRLDPGDVILSSPIGGNGGGESRLAADGAPIIGIHCRADDKAEYLGLGLIFLNQTPPAPKPQPAQPKPQPQPRPQPQQQPDPDDHLQHAAIESPTPLDRIDDL
jgi:hypothetical protein